MRELFNRVADIVSEVTEVSRYEMLHCNNECAVNARHLLIVFLSEDLTDGEIALLTGLTRAAVNFAKNNFHHRRRRYSVYANYQAISNKLDAEIAE